MKIIKEKIALILEWIIGISLAICLFAGGLGLIGFIFAFCLGGEKAIVICDWLSKTYYVFLIKASTYTTLLCFLLSYFNGKAKWVNPFRKK